jgi:hypothetical protein
VKAEIEESRHEPFLTGLNGCVATLSIAAGVIYLTNTEPVSAWKGSTGTLVALSARPSERVPTRPARPSSKTYAVAKNTEALPVDMTTTGALPDRKTETPPKPDEKTTLAHIQWCSQRYRSYRPEHNSYRSYSGSQRICISPFSDARGTRRDEQLQHADLKMDQPYVESAAEGEEMTTLLTPQHIASCFARYRSYRPEDNSYQPYGGGARRQCQ